MRTALLLGLTLLSSAAFAAPPAEKAPPSSTKKTAKAGQACKTNADCDQSGSAQACMSGKCEQLPMPAPPT